MLFNYTDCKMKYGSPYQIDKAVAESCLYKIGRGVYSDTGEENELEIIQWKYPAAIMTFDSAYFYYNLTDMIPEKYYMATDYSARKIADPLVRQYYMPRGTFEIGQTEIDYCGDKVRIYDLNRLLIETARMKNKLPSDLYKEVVLSFRSRISELEPSKIQTYLKAFPKREMIENILYEEVF